MFKHKFIAVFSIQILVLISTVSHAREPIQAQVDQAIPHGRFNLGVGSRLTLNVPRTDGSPGKNSEGVFLGRIIEPSGTFNKFMVLDTAQTRIYLADRNDLILDEQYSYQPILKQYDQVGETCTGYAIDHLFQQMVWSGFPGNGELKKILSTEKGRTQLLVEAVNEYYLVLKHQFSLPGVMRTFGEKFGYRCTMKTFDDSELATIFLMTKMNRGLPVMISFFIGPDMVTSTYEIEDYSKTGKGKLKDRRLWIPRKVGERKSGGHTIVAASMFESNGRDKLLMLDSDWAEPRIWDVKNYLGNKTAIKEVEFYTCE